MLETTVTIVNKLGLHARAAAKLVSLTSGFESEVLAEKDGRRVNAKSIMGVMMLAAAKGSRINLSINGPDEAQAENAIVDLINNRFGEPE